MAEFIEPIEIIIEQLRSLPGVGRKSAIRMAFGVAESDVAQVTAIITAGADVVIYLLAEGMADAAGAK